MYVMCQGVLAFTRDESKSCKTEFPGENDACKRLFLFFSESRFFCNSPDGHRMLKGRRQQEKHFSWLRRSFFFSWWNCQCKTLFQFYYLFVAIILYFKNAAYIKLQRTRTQQCLKILQKVSFYKFCERSELNLLYFEYSRQNHNIGIWREKSKF